MSRRAQPGFQQKSLITQVPSMKKDSALVQIFVLA